MQSIIAKRRVTRVETHDMVLTRSGVWPFVTVLQILIIFLATTVSIVLPLHFGNKADLYNEMAIEKETRITVMESKLDDLSREISYLETVVGVRAEK
ncbi:hypothetical protein [Kosmotoga pacifica]|uniref:Uncharacterized protein n=1 Tax=Kosmotoga pacifica TaxID=1330330 RepID=A0A0G2Z8D8_9BACT|nr:hypothetical protein [Kosmotoga pacifica]AKI97880.1 hypothetical protein IX53_08700 [Kosmotoga pacifica]